MIIFFKILSKHLKHLRFFFILFRYYRVSLNLKKSFLKYFFMILLDQRDDFLNLSILIKKKVYYYNNVAFFDIFSQIKNVF